MLLFLVFIQRLKEEKGIWVVTIYAGIFLASTLIYNLNLIPAYILKYYYSSLTAIEFFLFSYFVWLNVLNKTVKKIILWSSLIFLIFNILYTALAEVKIDSIPIGVETIFILVFSSYFLYERISDPKTLFIYNDYRFWIVLAFMLYLSGAFFIYIFANQIPESELKRYWMFTYIFYIVKNILFAVGILIFSLQQPNQKRHVQQSVKYY